MNYLAHFFLSGSDENIIIGNYIGDFVRGSELKNYSQEIQAGVSLHRIIDEFTDSHPLTIKAKGVIREDFDKYTPVVCDVFFDYFVGLHWHKYHNTPLVNFASGIYKTLNNHLEVLPHRSKRFLYYMETNDILTQYATIEGIGKVLYGLSHRAKFQSKMLGGEKVLNEKKAQLEEFFLPFFDDLVNECKQP